MPYWKRFIFLAVALIANVLTSNAQADSLGGIVVSVDTQSGQLVVKDKTKMTNRNFQVPKNTQITVDGKTAQLNRVEEGQSVTVFFTGTSASRLIVRNEKKTDDDATPTKPTKPEPKVTGAGKTPPRGTEIGRAHV